MDSSVFFLIQSSSNVVQIDVLEVFIGNFVVVKFILRFSSLVTLTCSLSNGG